MRNERVSPSVTAKRRETLFFAGAIGALRFPSFITFRYFLGLPVIYPFTFMYGRSYRSSRRFTRSPSYYRSSFTSGRRSQAFRFGLRQQSYSNWPRSYLGQRDQRRDELLRAYRDRSTIEAANTALAIIEERSRRGADAVGSDSSGLGHDGKRDDTSSGIGARLVSGSESEYDNLSESKLYDALRRFARQDSECKHRREQPAGGTVGDSTSSDLSLSGRVQRHCRCSSESSVCLPVRERPSERRNLQLSDTTQVHGRLEDLTPPPLTRQSAATQEQMETLMKTESEKAVADPPK